MIDYRNSGSDIDVRCQTAYWVRESQYGRESVRSQRIVWRRKRCHCKGWTSEPEVGKDKEKRRREQIVMFFSSATSRHLRHCRLGNLKSRMWASKKSHACVVCLYTMPCLPCPLPFHSLAFPKATVCSSARGLKRIMMMPRANPQSLWRLEIAAPPPTPHCHPCNNFLPSQKFTHHQFTVTRINTRNV